LVVVYTVGHSTRSLDELVNLLRGWGVETLVDIRSIPRSRKNPQFNADTLPPELAKGGIRYVHLSALGGLRGKKKTGPSRNLGWQVDAFRNFADYAQTEPFSRGLDELLGLASQSTCAIMCAEAVWWRCHRRIVADYLLVRGVRVKHILSEDRAEEAKLTPFATRAKSGSLDYHPE
jgi:uncharacterized protein (DUF488 family)